ncbi:MAG: hypothetical protein AAB197_05275, partial [Deltaproteobacteria bacterium]
GIFVFCRPYAGLSQMEHKMPKGESKVADNIKATLIVAPSKSVVDLLLVNAKTGKTITNAKVFAIIKGPGGKVEEKEFLGMQMKEVFSYMNTLDLSLKGSYSFNITAEAGKKKIKLDFVYEVK